MMETIITRRFVKERAPNRLALSPATMPEETSTSNLVRRIAYLGRDRGVLAVLHSRALEGGYRRNGVVGRDPSGADLELAVEVIPGQWLDLVLQAKTLKAVGNGYEYSEWKMTQNLALIEWARANGGRTPGTLLYNDAVLPFADATYRCTAFGACGGANHTQIQPYEKMKKEGWDLFDGTPAGISLCLNNSLLVLNRADPALIQSSHFPIEHLAHFGGHAGLVLPGDAESAEKAFLASIGDAQLHNQTPEWAQILLNSQEREERAELEEPPATSADEFQVVASVVIPFQSPA
jgi:hypothetical protein